MVRWWGGGVLDDITATCLTDWVINHQGARRGWRERGEDGGDWIGMRAGGAEGWSITVIYRPGPSISLPGGSCITHTCTNTHMDTQCIHTHVHMHWNIHTRWIYCHGWDTLTHAHTHPHTHHGHCILQKGTGGERFRDGDVQRYVTFNEAGCKHVHRYWEMQYPENLLCDKDFIESQLIFTNSIFQFNLLYTNVTRTVFPWINL